MKNSQLIIRFFKKTFLLFFILINIISYSQANPIGGKTPIEFFRLANLKLSTSNPYFLEKDSSSALKNNKLGSNYLLVDDLAKAKSILKAKNFSATPVSQGLRSLTKESALANDSINGQPVTLNDIQLTPGLPTHSGLRMQADGVVEIAPEVPAGYYQYPYTICDLADLTNCASAIYFISVDMPVLEANDDYPDPINRNTGGSIESILGNDRINGGPIGPFQVTISHQGFTPNLPYSMDSFGRIEIMKGATVGTYKLDYEIIQYGNSNNIANATVYLEIYERNIVANPDSYSGIVGHTGGLTTSVLDNDLLDNQPVDLTTVQLIPLRASSDSLLMNPDGTVLVKPYTPAGTYKYTYLIREIENPLNDADAEITITVVEADIEAVDDVATGINGKDGGVTQSVFENDLLAGQLLLAKDVKLKAGASPVSGMFMNLDGTVTIAPGTPSNTYNYPYQICELINPSNCSSAVMRITVSAAKIVAVDDISIGIHALTGGITQSVLANDQLNGVTVIPAEIVLTPDASPLVGMSMNIDGSVTVLAGTAAGTYNFGYKICERINPTNCSKANMLITVFANLIEAFDDVALGMNGYAGATTGSVLLNDRLNGEPFTSDKINLYPGTPPVDGMLMNPDGRISIPAGTPAGPYRFPYKICEVANPMNCSSAVMVITVVPAVIQALDDMSVGINGNSGGRTQSVLDNDLLNGLKIDPSTVRLIAGSSPVTGMLMNTQDGTVSVAPGTAAGNYTYPYMICSVLNPTNCSTAVMRIAVVVPGLTISKSADRSSMERIGELITYSILVKNTGGVNLKDVEITDLLFGNWAEKIGTLAAGMEHKVVLDYTVTQQDIERGRILNTARVQAKDSDDKVYTAEAKVEVLLKDKVMINLQKTADKHEVSVVGELINYRIQVENTGNKILYDIDVRDPLTGLNHLIKQLIPGEKEDVLTSYTMLRKDFESSALLNEAEVTAREANGVKISAKAACKVLIKTMPLLIPNVFTPNGDGLNDRFVIQGIEAYEKVSLKVFNVWGNEVYVNDKYDNNWNGQGLQDGTYYYSIEMRKGDKVEQFNAWVLIKRN